MDGGQAAQLVEVISAIEPDCRDRARLATAVTATARLRAWLDGHEVHLAAQLTNVGSPAEQVLAEAARVSPGEAGRVLERSRTAQECPS